MHDEIDMRDAERQFDRFLSSMGIFPRDGVISDHEWHRCPARKSNGRMDSTNGAYKIHLDGWPAGSAQNHGVTGVETWKYYSDRTFTKEQMDEFHRQGEEEARRRRAEREALYAIVARKAHDRWSRAKPVWVHRYLEDKGVASHGLRTDEDGDLLIPVINAKGNWQNLQRVFHDVDGKCVKLYLKGGRMKGGMFIIGKIDPEGVILIGEGYATLATLHEATGYPSVVAFNDSNLIVVTALTREKFPKARIVVCADNDHKTRDNPGVAKGKAAAEATGSMLAIPTVVDGTDFNDMAGEYGIDAVKEAIEAVINHLA
jgi:putative DNA primase/helicase